MSKATFWGGSTNKTTSPVKPTPAPVPAPTASPPVQIEHTDTKRKEASSEDHEIILKQPSQQTDSEKISQEFWGSPPLATFVANKEVVLSAPEPSPVHISLKPEFTKVTEVQSNIAQPEFTQVTEVETNITSESPMCSSDSVSKHGHDAEMSSKPISDKDVQEISSKQNSETDAERPSDPYKKSSSFWAGSASSTTVSSSVPAAPQVDPKPRPDLGILARVAPKRASEAVADTVVAAKATKVAAEPPKSSSFWGGSNYTTSNPVVSTPPTQVPQEDLKLRPDLGILAKVAPKQASEPVTDTVVAAKVPKATSQPQKSSSFWAGSNVDAKQVPAKPIATAPQEKPKPRPDLGLLATIGKKWPGEQKTTAGPLGSSNETQSSQEFVDASVPISRTAPAVPQHKPDPASATLATVRAQIEKLRNEAESYQERRNEPENYDEVIKPSSQPIHMTAGTRGTPKHKYRSAARIATSQAFRNAQTTQAAPAPVYPPKPLISSMPIKKPLSPSQARYTPYSQSTPSRGGHRGQSKLRLATVEEEEEEQDDDDEDHGDDDNYEGDEEEEEEEEQEDFHEQFGQEEADNEQDEDRQEEEEEEEESDDWSAQYEYEGDKKAKKVEGPKSILLPTPPKLSQSSQPNKPMSWPLTSPLQSPGGQQAQQSQGIPTSKPTTWPLATPVSQSSQPNLSTQASQPKAWQPPSLLEIQPNQVATPNQPIQPTPPPPWLLAAAMHQQSQQSQSNQPLQPPQSVIPAAWPTIQPQQSGQQAQSGQSTQQTKPVGWPAQQQQPTSQQNQVGQPSQPNKAAGWPANQKQQATQPTQQAKPVGWLAQQQQQSSQQNQAGQPSQANKPPSWPATPMQQASENQQNQPAQLQTPKSVPWPVTPIPQPNMSQSSQPSNIVGWSANQPQTSSPQTQTNQSTQSAKPLAWTHTSMDTQAQQASPQTQTGQSAQPNKPVGWPVSQPAKQNQAAPSVQPANAVGWPIQGQQPSKENQPSQQLQSAKATTWPAVQLQQPSQEASGPQQLPLSTSNAWPATSVQQSIPEGQKSQAPTQTTKPIRWLSGQVQSPAQESQSSRLTKPASFIGGSTQQSNQPSQVVQPTKATGWPTKPAQLSTQQANMVQPTEAKKPTGWLQTSPQLEAKKQGPQNPPGQVSKPATWPGVSQSLQPTPQGDQKKQSQSDQLPSQTDIPRGVSKGTKEKQAQTDILLKKLNAFADKITTNLSQIGSRWTAAPKTADDAISNLDSVLDVALRRDTELKMELKKMESRVGKDKKDFAGGTETTGSMGLAQTKEFFTQTEDSGMRDMKVIEEQSKTIEELVEKVTSLKQEKQLTLQKSQEETSKTNEQTKTIEHLLGQVTALKQEKNLLLNRTDRLKKEKTSLTEQVKKKDEDLETFRKRSDELRIQRDRIEGKLQTYMEQSFKYEDSNDKLKSKLDELETRALTLKKENDNLNRQNKDFTSTMERMKGEATRLKKTVAAKHFKSSQLQLELEKARVELTFSQNFASKVTSNKSTSNGGQIDEMQREIQQLRKSKKAQEKWNEMLKARVDTLLKEQSDRQDTEVMLRSAVHLLEEKEAILKIAVDKLEARALKFEEQVEHAELEKDAVKLELDALTCSYEALKNQCQPAETAKNSN